MLLEPPPVSEPLALSWYLSHGDSAVHGPFTFGTLLESAQLGRIARTTLVFHPDFTGGKWVTALGLPEIAAVASKPVEPPPASEPNSWPQGRAVQPDHTIDAPRDRARTKKGDWRSMLAQYRPNHPGKWIMLLATLIWAVGLPLAYGIGIAQAHHGADYQGESPHGIYWFGSYPIEEHMMPLRESYFVGRNVGAWSVVWGVIAIVGAVIAVAVPARPAD